MIGRLTGILIEKNAPLLLIDVNGVAYEVLASMNTIYKTPATDQKVTLHTHLIVREDAQTLYGFHSKAERELFKALIKVNGVGPKMAIAILSSTDVNGFVVCINQNDVTALTKIPGVGKKTAERLIVEMRDKLKLESSDLSVATQSGEHSAQQDAISALIALGYKPQHASQTVAKIAKDESNSDMLIRLALKELSRL